MAEDQAKGTEPKVDEKPRTAASARRASSADRQPNAEERDQGWMEQEWGPEENKRTNYKCLGGGEPPFRCPYDTFNRDQIVEHVEHDQMRRLHDHLAAQAK